MKTVSDEQMEPRRVRGLLDELGRRLDRDGISATVHVIGGSAMALRFPDDGETRSTRDIDATFQPREEILGVIAEMARELNMSPTWMNSSGTPFIPPRGAVPSTTERVTISVATVEELIAMKLAASREQDLYDLGILARHAGITEPASLVDIAFAAYGDDSMTLTESRADYLVMAEQALAEAERRARRGRRRPRSPN